MKRIIFIGLLILISSSFSLSGRHLYEVFLNSQYRNYVFNNSRYSVQFKNGFTYGLFGGVSVLIERNHSLEFGFGNINANFYDISVPSSQNNYRIRKDYYIKELVFRSGIRSRIFSSKSSELSVLNGLSINHLRNYNAIVHFENQSDKSYYNIVTYGKNKIEYSLGIMASLRVTKSLNAQIGSSFIYRFGDRSIDYKYPFSLLLPNNHIFVDFSFGVSYTFGRALKFG